MARLVDADELFARMMVVLGDNLDKIGTEVAYDIVLEIVKAPIVDPVRHGKWMKFDDGHYCSECKNMTYLHPMAYCPYCGAKMEESQW